MLFLRKAHIQLAVLVAAMAAAGCSYAASEQGSFDRTLTVSGPVRIDLSNGSGAVHIHGGQAGKVHIHAEVRAGNFLFGNARKELADIIANPPIEQSGDAIRIGKDHRRWHNISIEYVIETPEETEVDSTVGSGAQELRDVRGPVNLTTGSGSIHASRIGRHAELSTGSGSIEGSDIGEDARASTGSGSITLSTVKGAVRAHTGSGSISVSGADGPAELSTGSGSITSRGVSKDLSVHTASGHITVEGNPAANGNWELRSASGGVDITVPPSASFRFSAEAVSGNIHTNIPIVLEEQSRHALRARFGSGSARVEIHTVSGNISVHGGA